MSRLPAPVDPLSETFKGLRFLSQIMEPKELQILGQILHYLTCPLTLQLFKQPVLLSSGRAYQRTAIDAWLQQHSTDPFTRQELKSKVYYKDWNLSKIMQTVKRQVPQIPAIKLPPIYNKLGVERIDIRLKSIPSFVLKTKENNYAMALPQVLLIVDPHNGFQKKLQGKFNAGIRLQNGRLLLAQNKNLVEVQSGQLSKKQYLRGVFASCGGICQGPQFIYFSDQIKNRISKVNKETLTCSQLLIEGLSKPKSLVLHQDELIIADYGNHRILAFADNKTREFKIPQRCSLRYPSYICYYKKKLVLLDGTRQTLKTLQKRGERYELEQLKSGMEGVRCASSWSDRMIGCYVTREQCWLFQA